mmetsp:Transcript_56716/g.135080  ORF Transcript_56716/g.135080 Transcript_56716/m.135080 type:complete len:289 (-) Transcript_56716:118-984(-)|eukprot:CAMPEP_0178415420 /NCGR_PEP_ID=MMETSP0689_2-20121128/23541_1 /TAXON_ID=160604 /ORGANISM="Amphidinium massartii, Strain CS-259" /LENGTH=288 /DNA_ID=CAMNT_0020036737 /DNA_START=68 /DNA_END=934 /DNA_ORIENTATION=+
MPAQRAEAPRATGAAQNSASGGASPPSKTARGEQPASLTAALAAFEDASEPNERSLRCAGSVLEHQSAARYEAEVVLQKLYSWFEKPVKPQVNKEITMASLPGVLVRTLRRFNQEPPLAALVCMVVVRASGTQECANAHVRAGIFTEVGELMDLHGNHGGVQNVCCLLVCEMAKDNGVARQAVSHGIVPRLTRALENSCGREVQYNGCVALRLLADGGRAPRTGLQEAAFRAKSSHQGDDVLVQASDELLATVTPRFKEVLCWHFQSGWCRLGPRCTYAHGQNDLRSN